MIAATAVIVAASLMMALSVVRTGASSPEAMTLTLYTAKAEGVVHWFPATLVVERDTPLTLVLVNTLRRQHWFQLVGTEISIPVPGGSARTAQITIARPGTYPFLDPHDPTVVGGRLIVTEPDESP